jgi:ligand-binding sensor domain-containing protein
MSEDYGTTWKQLGTNLPLEPLNVVTEDPLLENILYVGSDNGLYSSFDLGKSFMNMDNNLPRVPIHDLVIQQRENELVVGTHGRSIYITKLDSIHKIYNSILHNEKVNQSK